MGVVPVGLVPVGLVRARRDEDVHRERLVSRRGSGSLRCISGDRGPGSVPGGNLAAYEVSGADLTVHIGGWVRTDVLSAASRWSWGR